MEHEQIKLVQQSWTALAQVKHELGGRLYEQLFYLDPGLKPLFRADMREQGEKLVDMIDMAVRGLSRIEFLLPMLASLGFRHRLCGVRDHDYQTVGQALLITLRMGLGEKFTPEVKHAWVAVYELISTTMRKGVMPAEADAVEEA